MNTFTTSYSSDIFDSNGELVGHSVNNVKTTRKRGDSFSYRYEGECMNWLKGIKSIATPILFNYLTCLLRAGSPYVLFSARDRERFLSEFSYSEPTLCKALDELEKKDVIIRKTVKDYLGNTLHAFRRGEMMLNPHIVWKGSSPDRKKAIKDYDQFIFSTAVVNHADE